MNTTPDHADIVEVIARGICTGEWDTVQQWVRDERIYTAKRALASLAAAGFVVVSADTIAAIKSMITIEAIAPAIHEFEIEKRKQAWAKIEAMLATK